MSIIKHGNNALSNVTAFPSAIPTGKPVLLSTATASSSASIEFTSGIDSTYDIYKWEFNSMHPQTDDGNISFQFSTNGGSSYGLTKTSTYFRAYQAENDSGSALQYLTSKDLAQSTSAQQTQGIGNADDETSSGYLYLFAPSSSVYVKHYMLVFNTYETSNYSINQYCAGYINNTSPVNAIKFTMSSGNIDAGTIKMYGISA